VREAMVALRMFSRLCSSGSPAGETKVQQKPIRAGPGASNAIFR
jgi:hypothetical protein